MPTDVPRTEAGRTLLEYMATSFVYEADDTEPVDITDRILAIEAEAAAPSEPLRAALERLRSEVHEYMEQSNRYGHGLTIDRDDFDTYVDATIEQYALQASPPTAQPESPDLCGNDEWDSRYACVKPKGHALDGPGLTSHDYRVKRRSASPSGSDSRAIELLRELDAEAGDDPYLTDTERKVRAFLKEPGAVPASGEGAE